MLVWTSPLLITQYKYSSSVLNKWNGQTFIENEDGEPTGRIFSTSLISGQMNNSNQFTGVIIGSLEDLVEDTRVDQTGIYGYKDGVQTYAFKDDGTAFIGSGSSRINLDGANGLLASASWLDVNGKLKSEKDFLEAGKSGAYINLDDGSFFFAGEKNNYLKLDENGKLVIKGSITSDEGFIGNWQITKSGMIYESMDQENEYVEYRVKLSPENCFLSSHQYDSQGEVQGQQMLELYQNGAIVCSSIESSETSHFTDLVTDRFYAEESIETPYIISSKSSISVEVDKETSEWTGEFIGILDRENRQGEYNCFLGLMLTYQYDVDEDSPGYIGNIPMKLQWYQDYSGMYYLTGTPVSIEWQEKHGLR